MADARVLGWREWAGLPDFGINFIKAKMDTGAWTSAIHATDVQILGKGSFRRARFRLHPSSKNLSRFLEVEAPLVDVRGVRSSVGHLTERPVIRTTLRLAGVDCPIELTLVDRGPMAHRLLVGRAALRGLFIVDPARSFLLGRLKGLKAAFGGAR